MARRSACPPSVGEAVATRARGDGPAPRAGPTRDLFAWAVEHVGAAASPGSVAGERPGLGMGRFGAYRQHVLDRLRELGYVPGWTLLADRSLPMGT